MDSDSSKKIIWGQLLGFFIISFAIYFFYNLNSVLFNNNTWENPDYYWFNYSILLISIVWFASIFYKNHSKSLLPSLAGLIYLIILLAVMFTAHIGQLRFVIELGAIVIFWLLIYIIFGKVVAREQLKPFTCLLAVLPIISLVSPIFYSWTKYFLIFNFDSLGFLFSSSKNALELNNIFVVIDKSTISFNALIATLGISLIYSCIKFSSILFRLLFVISSILTVFLLGLLKFFLFTFFTNNYYSADTNFNLNFYFIILSWIVYIFSIYLIYRLSELLIYLENLYLGLFNANLQYTDSSKLVLLDGFARLYFVLIAVVFLLFQFAGLLSLYDHIVQLRPPVSALKFPDIQSNWSMCGSCDKNNWYPRVGRPDAKTLLTYKKSSFLVDYYMGYYNHQYQGNELVQYGNYMFYDPKWEITKLNQKKLYLNKSDHALKINRVYLSNDNTNRVIWYWFWINGHATNNPMYAKFYELLDVLTSFETHSALVAISGEYFNETSLDLAESALYEFLNDNINDIYPSIRKIAVNFD